MEKNTTTGAHVLAQVWAGPLLEQVTIFADHSGSKATLEPLTAFQILVTSCHARVSHVSHEATRFNLANIGTIFPLYCWPRGDAPYGLSMPQFSFSITFLSS